MKEPKVTVLMPVYNGERYLREAIDSILNQTFTDFEFLIINDGSTDRSVEIIKSYNDPRIRLVNNKKNLKLIATLNRGLVLAEGEYIARMDCDDISLQKRLEKQAAFMDAHPEVGVCGTWVKTIGKSARYISKYPRDDETIRCQMLFRPALAHPSVMIRKSIFAKYDLAYNSDYIHGEDYELWVRASRHMLLANIEEILVLYRLHPEQIGYCHREKQQVTGDSVRLNQIMSLGIRPTQEELDLHRSISTLRFEASKNFIRQADAWLCRLKEVNEKKSIYSESVFSKVLGERWLAVCKRATGLGIWLWKEFKRSPLSEAIMLSQLQKVSFGIKCGLLLGKQLL